MKEARIEAHGRIQGVGFRRRVKSIARGLDLKGSVMNLANGDILIIAQGSEENIHELIMKLENNPGFSKVESVDVAFGEVIKRYDGFMIVKEGSFFVDQWKAMSNLFRRVFYNHREIENVPQHIVIIPDGNRRWAKFRNLEPHFGHYKSGSYINMELLLREAKNLGVKCFSVWGFSTENWKRSEEERKAIFDLVLGGVKKFRDDAKKNKMRFRHIGRKDRLPKKLVLELERLERVTEKYDDFTIQLCLDYGGRDEIIRAVNKVLSSGLKKIDEGDFCKYLDTYGVGDPDLVIRTSGENRLSGFMPFQSAYAELYFSKLYFPEFGPVELRKAVEEYGKRVRRFGGDK